MAVLLTCVCVCVFPPAEEVKAVVVEDPCKCEARLAFQKQTQSAIQQLTAKHILHPLSTGLSDLSRLAGILEQGGLFFVVCLFLFSFKTIT